MKKRNIKIVDANAFFETIYKINNAMKQIKTSESEFQKLSEFLLQQQAKIMNILIRIKTNK